MNKSAKILNTETGWRCKIGTLTIFYTLHQIKNTHTQFRIYGLMVCISAHVRTRCVFVLSSDSLKIMCARAHTRSQVPQHKIFAWFSKSISLSPIVLHIYVIGYSKRQKSCCMRLPPYTVISISNMEMVCQFWSQRVSSQWPDSLARRRSKLRWISYSPYGFAGFNKSVFFSQADTGQHRVIEYLYV